MGVLGEGGEAEANKMQTSKKSLIYLSLGLISFFLLLSINETTVF